MQLENEQVLLRDIAAEDIVRRLRWETEETEWQLWDAPWEYEALTPGEKAAELETYAQLLRRRVEKAATIPRETLRHSFEIVEKASGVHVGWVSAYGINAKYAFCTGDDNAIGLAVGVDIPDQSRRGRGIATGALQLFIAYLQARGAEAIYTQTWSGNVRMIGLAHKLGFREVHRKPGIRLVRGERYDGLTFRLEPR